MPIAAYFLSGEYSQIKAAAERGWLDETRAVLESHTAVIRVGADMIITYIMQGNSPTCCEPPSSATTRHTSIERVEPAAEAEIRLIVLAGPESRSLY